MRDISNICCEVIWLLQWDKSDFEYLQSALLWLSHIMLSRLYIIDAFTCQYAFGLGNSKTSEYFDDNIMGASI